MDGCWYFCFVASIKSYAKLWWLFVLLETIATIATIATYTIQYQPPRTFRLFLTANRDGSAKTKPKTEKLKTVKKNNCIKNSHDSNRSRSSLFRLYNFLIKILFYYYYDCSALFVIFKYCFTSLLVPSLNSIEQLTQSAATKKFDSIFLGYIFETQFPVRTFRLSWLPKILEDVGQFFHHQMPK